MTRYPNLLELHRHHPYGVPVLCDHARIEQELLRAVLYEGEQLLPTEIRGIEFATPKPERRQLRRRNGEGRGADVCQDKGVL